MAQEDEKKLIFIEGKIIVAILVSISEFGRITGRQIGYGISDPHTGKILFHKTEETHFYGGTSWYIVPFKGEFSD